MENVDFELERIANALERLADHFAPEPKYNPRGAALPRSAVVDPPPPWK